MRLDKFLVECGICSRRETKDLVKGKMVFLNGAPAKAVTENIVLGQDKVEFEGKTLEYKEFRYYVMNKREGYITAVQDYRDPTVMDLLPEWVNRKDLFPVGRLDKDTVGLLLFTNNGKLAHELISPRKHVDKIYYVELEKKISDRDMKLLEEGVDIGGYITKPAKAERVSENKIYLNIQEGKFHQVKKMMHAVSNDVTYLKRVKFGNLELGNMELGSVKEIELSDIIKK
ncbi:MAG: pseudouridine synthase [Fusobacteriaceae bacterium]